MIVVKKQCGIADGTTQAMPMMTEGHKKLPKYRRSARGRVYGQGRAKAFFLATGSPRAGAAGTPQKRFGALKCAAGSYLMLLVPWVGRQWPGGSGGAGGRRFVCVSKKHAQNRPHTDGRSLKYSNYCLFYICKYDASF